MFISKAPRSEVLTSFCAPLTPKEELDSLVCEVMRLTTELEEKRRKVIDLSRQLAHQFD